MCLGCGTYLTGLSRETSCSLGRHCDQGSTLYQLQTKGPGLSVQVGGGGGLQVIRFNSCPNQQGSHKPHLHVSSNGALTSHQGW